MLHITKSRKFSINVTVHLANFDGQDNETLIFCPLQVADDVFERISMRGFWAVSES